jgi:GT2 family glycosyltransferase
MPGNIDLSIIIVATNEKDHLERCLSSVQKSLVRYSLETIVIDNASLDGTSGMVASLFPQARLIRNRKKKGYIENNNAAMRLARGRYFLVLNSDIDLGSHTLETMLDFMESRPDAGVSACRLTFDDGDLQYTCRRFPTPLTYLFRFPHFLRWMKAARGLSRSPVVDRYLMRDYDHKTTREVDWFLSAFFLMRRSALEDVGMFSRWLFQPFYLEDMEWCFRARLKGWKAYYVPGVSAVHFYRRGSVRKFSRLSLVHMGNICVFYLLHGWQMALGRHRER